MDLLFHMFIFIFYRNSFSMFILIILSLSYPYMPYVSLNYVLCWCFVVMYINCIVAYGRTSCKTASGWWDILVKYVLIKNKIKNKKWKGFGWTLHTYAIVANFYFVFFHFSDAMLWCRWRCRLRQCRPGSQLGSILHYHGGSTHG